MVVLFLHDLVAFRAFVVEVDCFFKVHACAGVSAEEEEVVFFSDEAFSGFSDLFFFDLNKEFGDDGFVEVPVANVPSFYLVFFSVEVDEVVF